MEKLRIDKYLWAIRIFKTRTQAAAACDGGKVKSNGAPVKASKHIITGEQLEIKTPARKWVIQVTGLLDHRVQYQEAVQYYADITPEEDLQYNKRQAASFYTGKRQSKIGRPTKKQRRDLDNLNL
jgi:ribosome-associated heat shock protein Hsp15